MRGMNTRFIDMIARAGSPRITVVGDLILDAYVHGDAERISPEAPIQVLEVDEERVALGGAANVAANLKSLGAEVELCGVLGDDGNGAQLRRLLEEGAIGTTGVMTDPARPTTYKTRVLAHNQQLIRIDREVRTGLSAGLEKKLLEGIGPVLDRSELVVLSDYAKGVLVPSLIRKVLERAGTNVLVDPKGKDFSRYGGCRLITPNRLEAEEATGVSIEGREDLVRAADAIFESVGVREVVITLGAEGIFYAKRRGDHNLIPAHTRSVYDVTGAGDTVLSLLAFSLATGADLDDAVRIANAGAGIVVGKLGVAAPTRQELIDFFAGGTTHYTEKILDRTLAVERAESIRRSGETLVFTNGCFDLLHGGHLSYLRAAKGMGDYLMVGVNDDASVQKLKGPLRPILPIDERLEILASLQVVDFVVPFPEETPLNLIQAITPKVLVKGEDWREKGVVGREWVEQHGGEVILIPLKEGHSTSHLIDRVLHRHDKEGKP